MPDTRKEIVLLLGDGRSSRFLYNYLKQHFEIKAAFMETPVSRKQLIKRRAKKLGWWTVLGQLTFQVLMPPFLKRSAAAQEQKLLRKYQLNDSEIDAQKLIAVSSVNDAATIEKLQALNPSVVVVNGTRIISKRVLEAVAAPFINTHAGITPMYRGVHGGYWALASGDLENCGVTIHFVDKGIDTGGIISQHLIEPEPLDNFTTYPLHQLGVALPFLKEAIQKILAGNMVTRPMAASSSQLWYHPTIWTYLRNRLAKGVK